MQEETLLELYFSRSETALEQTKQQYGTYCYAIAYRILSQPQDAEECENETYWKAWQAIPPNRPHSLKAFLGKITRNLALHFWERNHAAKRGGNAVDLALDELTECIPASDSVEQAADAAALQAAADIAGFSLDAPDAYEAYDHTVIQAIEGEMIEVIYEDASETEGLRIRKGVGTDPISGDYNRYDSEETQTIAGISVSVRKNGDLIFVAEWTDGGYAHSITSEDGLTADELETLFSQIH